MDSCDSFKTTEEMNKPPSNYNALVHEIVFKLERLYGDYVHIVCLELNTKRDFKNNKINKTIYDRELSKYKNAVINTERNFDEVFKRLYTNDDFYNNKLSFILSLIKTYPKQFREWLSLLCIEINKYDTNNRFYIL
jgi:hypothetical protein